jgi:hypothetical protein
MHIGVILPHTLLYGGVKRYLLLGNWFVTAGHVVCYGHIVVNDPGLL